MKQNPGRRETLSARKKIGQDRALLLVKQR